jgi:PhnB protein
MKQFFIPYFTFKNSKEVADYYISIFGGEIAYVMYGRDMPEFTKEEKDQVMHLEVKIRDNFLYMGDGKEENIQKNMFLLLNYDNLDEQNREFEKMKEESTIIEDLHDTFWGARFGVLKDKYGVMWEFHCPLKR